MKSKCYMIMDNKEYNIHLVREVVFDEQTPSTLQTKENSSKLLTNIFNNDNYIFETPIINMNDYTNTSNEEANYDESISKNINVSTKGSSSKKEIKHFFTYTRINIHFIFQYYY